jgi:APA family basic amino acid/polyamine antiporter
MAGDGVFFKAVATVHPRFGTPARAIAIQASLASVLVLSGSFNGIVAYFIFVTVLFLALTVAGLFVIRRRAGQLAPSGYRTPGYPLTPMLFLALVAVLLVLLAGHNPLQAVLGLGIVGLGAPVYYWLFRDSHPEGVRTRAAHGASTLAAPVQHDKAHADRKPEGGA